jgi:nickel-type superoxide dismutase maturation protease
VHAWPLLRVEVAEQSMLPALRPGDWLLARRTRRIRPGQVVLAWHPSRPGFLLVKRAARRVEGGWWLQSDNPAAGAVDSGRFGPVPEEKVVGRVLVRYWPLRRSLSRILIQNGPVVTASAPHPPGGCGADG